MAIPPSNYISATQYVALEEQAETKNKYYRSEVFMLAGTTPRHNTIKQNGIIALRKRLKGKGCRVCDENIRLEVEKEEQYTYPTVIVICHPEDNREKTTMRHPSVIMEVLSDSTESDDRGLKFQPHRKLLSLQHYVLVSQNRCLVECFTRGEDNTCAFITFDTPESRLSLPNPNILIPLEEVYDEIPFDRCHNSIDFLKIHSPYL